MSHVVWKALFQFLLQNETVKNGCFIFTVYVLVAYTIVCFWKQLTTRTVSKVTAIIIIRPNYWPSSNPWYALYHR